MRSFAFVLALGLAACSGDKPAEIDANPNGPLCTGAAYDNCNTEHDCMSGNCHLFMADGFQVCTTACSATLPCPNDSSGAPATCNPMSICKPVAANVCHL